MTTLSALAAVDLPSGTLSTASPADALSATHPADALSATHPADALFAAVSQQVAPTPGGPLAFAGTIVLSWLFFGFAAQVAATFLLGDVPWRCAAVVGIVPAVTVGALISYPPAVILVVALAADLFAIQAVYRLRYRTAAAVAFMHVVVAISLGVPLATLVELLGTAPA